MFITFSGDHLVSDVFGLTVDTRNTPLSIPMRCSPDRTSHPNQIPSLHLSSNYPGMTLVLGMRECSNSNHFATLPLDLRPFNICRAVRSFGLILHLMMK